MMFLMIMILGTLMTISSQSWLGMWMGLEMNMMGFIPLLFKTKSKNASESCMIYFLIQSMGSILMLMSILNNSLVVTSPLMTNELFNSLLMFSMMMKLGMPPFHFWFTEIMEKMKWENCWILMTWQKIAPMTILSYTLNMMNLVLPMLVMITVTVGAIGGLNQVSIRKIMSYSSINHMGWMVACMQFNNENWTNYLIIYAIITSMVVYTFNIYTMYFINQFQTNTSWSTKMTITILLLSLGGIPPFLGFLPKWLVIQSMINSNAIFMLIIMIMSTLITLYYYLRLTSINILVKNTTNKWIPESYSNTIFIYLTMMINLSLPLLTFSL